MTDLPTTEAVSDPFAHLLNHTFFIGPPAPAKAIGTLSVSHVTDWDSEGE